MARKEIKFTVSMQQVIDAMVKSRADHAEGEGEMEMGMTEESAYGVATLRTFIHSNEINEIGTALAKAQKEMSPAKKGSTNPFFSSTYANLGAIMEASMPKLNEEGIAVLMTPVPRGVHSFSEEKEERGVVIKTTVYRTRVGMACRFLHSSGQWIEGYAEADAKGTDAQAVGSCITYLRRYILGAMAGVAAEDDDGNAASGRSTSNTATAKATRRRAANDAALGKDALALRDGLRQAILDHCEGDAEEAKSILRDCSSGKSFDGFGVVTAMTKDWQVENAVERFEKLTGEKVKSAKA